MKFCALQRSTLVMVVQQRKYVEKPLRTKMVFSVLEKKLKDKMLTIPVSEGVDSFLIPIIVQNYAKNKSLLEKYYVLPMKMTVVVNQKLNVESEQKVQTENTVQPTQFVTSNVQKDSNFANTKLLTIMDARWSLRVYTEEKII